MHPRNKMRLLAGLPIDASLEKTPVTEARAVPRRRSELATKSAATIKAHVDGVAKAIQHLQNAVKSLERIPAHDFMGDIPNVIADIEEIISADGGEAGLEQLLKAYNTQLAQLNESHVDKDKDKKVQDKETGKSYKVTGHSKGEGPDEKYDLEDKSGRKTVKKAKDLIDEAELPGAKPTTSQQFKDGDVILYDDGIYVVVLSDPQADMIGIIPAGLANASADEKNRSVEMVKPDKVRKPTEEEMAVMRQSPEQRAKIDDDMAAQFSMESVDQEKRKMAEAVDPNNLLPWAREAIAQEGVDFRDAKLMSVNEYEFKQIYSAPDYPHKPRKLVRNLYRLGDTNVFMARVAEKIDESTHNYKGHQVSHEDTVSDPINVVGQGDKQWANSLDPKSVKSEVPTQLDNRGDASMGDYETKIKCPARLKNDLRDAIQTFRRDAEKQGSGHTGQETAQLYMDTADAFEKILGHLEAGTLQELKKAQLFATSLMGPMLHKLPDGVWDFITNGGQKRSLKDYMIKVGK